MNPEIENLKVSLSQDPNNWATRTHLCELLYQVGASQESANLLLQAPNIPADDSQLMTATGILVGSFPQAAVEFADKAIEFDPNRAAAHFAKAQANNANGDPNSANMHYQTACQLNPGYADPQYASMIGLQSGTSTQKLMTASQRLQSETTQLSHQDDITPVVPVNLQHPDQSAADVASPAMTDSVMLSSVPKLAEKDDTKEKISSAILALLLLTAIIFLAGLITLFSPKALPPEITAVNIGEPTEEVVQREQVVQNSPASAPSPVQNVMKTIVSTAVSPITMPVIDQDIPDAPLALSNGLSSLSFGGGGGSGGGFAGVPSVMRNRCSKAERSKLLKQYGGKQSVEQAVVSALDWFQSNQAEDGSWDGLAKSSGHRGGMTGLALLSYLGHCQTPDSDKYGDTVLNAIMYLVELSEKDEGYMATGDGRHIPYEHGIATYALGETYALAKSGQTPLPGLKEAYRKSIQIIIDNQNDNGGWAYSYNTNGESDLSVSSWQFQALKTAEYNKVKVTGLKEALRDTLELYENTPANTGAFPYRTDGDPTGDNRWSLTGSGVLALQFLNSDREDIMKAGLDYIFNGPDIDRRNVAGKSHPQKSLHTDKTWVGKNDTTWGNKGNGGWETQYGWYYHTQACFQAGGDYWERWNELFSDAILDAQHGDGSWTTQGKSPNAYDTAMATLMLEVYYRYLPATGGK